MDKLIEKIQSISADDRRIVSNKLTWLREQSIVNKFYHYFYPHSEVYQSPLIPLFLYELEDFEMLNYFPVVLARDGGISLMKFFFDNPKPEKIKTPILINKSLQGLVPMAWKNKIAFYEYAPKRIEKIGIETDKIVITLFADPQHASLEYARLRFDKIKEKIERGHFPEIKCYFNYKIPVGEESHDKHHTKHLFQVTTLVNESFPQCKIGYLTNDDLKSENFNNSLLVDLNEFCFFFSDCFVRHFILAQGAKELSIGEDSNEGFDIPYSFNHSLRITEKYEEGYELAAKEMESDLVLLRKSLENAEKKISRDSYQFEDVQICSEELRAFSYQQLKKLNFR